MPDHLQMYTPAEAAERDLEQAARYREQDARPTFRTRHRVCDNCGHGLLDHEDQRYCPAPAPADAPHAGGGANV